MTTTTTRRTARITPAKPSRGYIAIHCDYIAPTTTMLHCTANKAMHIEGTNGASLDIAVGQKFCLVRSESLGEDMFYIVLKSHVGKKCTCAANKPCKHEIAVQVREQVRASERIAAVVARAESAKETKVPPVAPVVVEAVATRPSGDTRTLDDKIAGAALNGQQGFRFLR